MYKPKHILDHSYRDYSTSLIKEMSEPSLEKLKRPHSEMKNAQERRAQSRGQQGTQSQSQVFVRMSADQGVATHITETDLENVGIPDV